jgi:hypothetical protein
MKDLNDDKLTRDILRNSYLEPEDPDFKRAMMARIMRESRRRHILNNVLVNLMVFVATDALIYSLLRLTGLSVADLAYRSVDLLNRILFHTGQLKIPVAGNNLPTLLLLSFAGVIAILTIMELGMSAWKSRGHGGGSVPG